MSTMLMINWIAFILVTGYAIYLFARAVSTRVSYIRLGKKADFDLDLKKRIKRIMTIVFGHKKLFKDKKSGIIHLLLFYGFILVQFGAIDMFIKGLAAGNHLRFGPLYPGFKFFQEVVTLTVLVAVVWAFYRRYMEKLPRLEPGFSAGLVLIFIGTLMLTVLLGNGLSQVWHGVEATWTDVVATAIAAAFAWLSPVVAKISYYVVWWIHTRTEEHTSELQSRGHLVSRLLLEQKNKTIQH